MTPQTREGFEKWMPITIMVITSIGTLGYQKAIFDEHSRRIDKAEAKIETHESRLNTNDRDHDGFNYRLNTIDLKFKL